MEFLTLLEKESFGKKRKSLGGASESRLCSAQEITWQDMARPFPLRRDQLEIPKKSTVFTTHFYYILLLLNFDLRNASPHRHSGAAKGCVAHPCAMCNRYRAAGLSTAVGGLRFRPGPLVGTWKWPKQWLVLEGPRWA